MTQIQPLQVKNHLAPHSAKPELFVTIKNSAQANIECADPKATRALIALMDMYAVLGGAASHYGGPAALAELWSALHAYVFTQAEQKKKNWYDLFHLINDAGHCENGLYALKANYKMAGLTFDSLKKFRSIESKLTGHGEAHLFSEGVYMSNGPLGSAFPQSQGLALAEKMAGTQRTTICTLSDGAAMEGEAKEAFAAIPGLAKKGLCAPYVLIISDNNTKLSGKIDSDSFSMTPTFLSLQNLGWTVQTLEQGNDLEKCFQALETAITTAQAYPDKPVVLWAKTIKGIGTQKTANSATGAHGFPCKSPIELSDFISEIYAGETYPEFYKAWIAELLEIEKKQKAAAVQDTGEKIQKGVAKALIEAFKKGLPIVSITSDLPGSTGVADFRKEFPQASLDVGIAESNMISTAAGFSKQGFIPVVDTFAQFGVTKGALPITMAQLSEAGLIAIFSHTGFQDAADGASHQALSYMAMLATIPHVDLYSLSTSEEAEKLLTQVLENYAKAVQAGQTPRTSVFFLGRENFPKTYSTEAHQLNYVLGEPQTLRSHTIGSKNVMLLTTGSLVGETLKASQELEKLGVGSIVVNVHSLNQFNALSIKEALKKCEGRIVTIEDHQVLLGLGSYVSHQLMQQGIPALMKSLGVKGHFGQSAYNAIELYRLHKMDSVHIIKAALELLG